MSKDSFLGVAAKIETRGASIGLGPFKVVPGP